MAPPQPGDPPGTEPTGTLDRPSSDVYADLAGFIELPRSDRRQLRSRSRSRLAAVALISVAVGIALNAAILHVGGRPPRASLVIGEKVIRKSPPGSVRHSPSPARTSPLVWGPTLTVDPSTPLTGVSCPTSGFCAAVDAQGHALQYTGQGWSAPRAIAGAALTAVSCANPAFCVAVDREGDALIYDGRAWTAPQRIDKTTFPELTSVSCSSPSFCAAVDGDGNGFSYNGKRWSPPQQVDPQGWSLSLVSRDVPQVSCPTDGFCVGVDQQNNAFFYVANSWQTASPVSATGGAPNMKFDNSISCSSASFCMATQNLGQLVAYDGTQWSLPVAADPSNYVVSVSCASSSFCAAVDSLLPPGFNSDSGNGNGEVLAYNGIDWSAPQQVDEAGIVTALSCPSAQFCMVVDDGGHAVTGSSPG